MLIIFVYKLLDKVTYKNRKSLKYPIFYVILSIVLRYLY